MINRHATAAARTQRIATNFTAFRFAICLYYIKGLQPLRPVKIYVNRRTPGFSRGFGWGGRIRTCASRSQSPLPYPLATPHRNLIMLPIDGSYAFGFKQALRRSFRDSIFPPGTLFVKSTSKPGSGSFPKKGPIRG